MIIDAINAEMRRLPEPLTTYRRLLDTMEERTVESGNHVFLTTNWDFLLEREILSWVGEHHPGDAPRFSRNSQLVYHFNGTTEDRCAPLGSPFLLETDSAAVRRETFEADEALGRLLWSNLVVVVGMSFECQSDRGLLAALRVHEDNLPIGSGLIIVVEPFRAALDATRERLAAYFPRARVVAVQTGLGEWIDSEMPELRGNIFVIYH